MLSDAAEHWLRLGDKLYKLPRVSHRVLLLCGVPWVIIKR